MSRKDRLDPRYLPLQKMLEKYHVTVEVNKMYKGTVWPIAAVYTGRSNYVYVRAWDGETTKTVYIPDGATTFEAPFSYLITLRAVQLVLEELAFSTIYATEQREKNPGLVQGLMKKLGLLRKKPVKRWNTPKVVLP